MMARAELLPATVESKQSHTMRYNTKQAKPDQVGQHSGLKLTESQKTQTTEWLLKSNRKLWVKDWVSEWDCCVYWHTDAKYIFSILCWQFQYRHQPTPLTASSSLSSLLSFRASNQGQWRWIEHRRHQPQINKLDILPFCCLYCLFLFLLLHLIYLCFSSAVVVFFFIDRIPSVGMGS